MYSLTLTFLTDNDSFKDTDKNDENLKNDGRMENKEEKVKVDAKENKRNDQRVDVIRITAFIITLKIE